MFLGRKSEGDSKKIIVEDAIPLFHQKVVSGSLEIAFEMIEASLVNETTKIVGVYEAPIIGADTMQFPSNLAMGVATQIKNLGHFAEPCIMSLIAVNQRSTEDRE